MQIHPFTCETVPKSSDYINKIQCLEIIMHNILRRAVISWPWLRLTRKVIESEFETILHTALKFLRAEARENNSVCISNADQGWKQEKEVPA